MNKEGLIRRHNTCSQMLLLVAIALAWLSNPSSTASAFSDRSPTLWGILGDKVSSLGQHHDKSITSKRSVQAKSAVHVSSAVDYSIQSKVQVGDDSSTTALNGNGEYPLRIIIMGGPASGKGTQCEKIASEYGVIHLSTGDMLREAVRQGSDIGMVAQFYMDAGELVPDEIMIQIVTERISQADCQRNGYLLDGFPRTPAQAEALEKMGISADLFVFLDVPDAELIARVVGRRLDPVTGKIYHLKYFPPPANVVDRLTQRSDDTVEKMTNRLQQFHSNVNAVRSYYDNVLVQVNGTGTPESITKRIATIIDSRIRRGNSASLDKKTAIKR